MSTYRNVYVEPHTDAWYAERMIHVGASEAAAAAGLSPYNSRLGLYLEKTGEIEREDMGARGEWGLRMEDTIAIAFHDEHEDLLPVQREVICVSNEWPWMSCTPDRFIINNGPIEEDSETLGLLELKTVGTWGDVKSWGTKDKPELPGHYEIQVQYQLAVTGLPWCWIAVLIFPDDFRTFRVERDEEMIKDLVKTSGDFWKLVQHKTPPSVDGSEHTADALKRKYATGEADSVIQVEEDFYELAAEFHAADEALKEAKRVKQLAENRIKDVLGENEIAKVKDHVIATWKRYPIKEHMVKASVGRKLSVKEL